MRRDKNITNKKVLLPERKRHAARRVAALSPDLPTGGGVPPSSPDGGGEVPPTRHHPTVPIGKDGVPPSPHPDLGRGTPLSRMGLPPPHLQV